MLLCIFTFRAETVVSKKSQDVCCFHLRISIKIYMSSRFDISHRNRQQSLPLNVPLQYCESGTLRKESYKPACQSPSQCPRPSYYSLHLSFYISLQMLCAFLLWGQKKRKSSKVVYKFTSNQIHVIFLQLWTRICVSALAVGSVMEPYLNFPWMNFLKKCIHKTHLIHRAFCSPSQRLLILCFNILEIKKKERKKKMAHLKANPYLFILLMWLWEAGKYFFWHIPPIHWWERECFFCLTTYQMISITAAAPGNLDSL